VDQLEHDSEPTSLVFGLSQWKLSLGRKRAGSHNCAKQPNFKPRRGRGLPTVSAANHDHSPFTMGISTVSALLRMFGNLNLVTRRHLRRTEGFLRTIDHLSRMAAILHRHPTSPHTVDPLSEPTVECLHLRVRAPP